MMDFINIGNTSLQIGDLVKLKDKIGKDYKPKHPHTSYLETDCTKFLHQDMEWVPSFSSEEDFKFVKIFFKSILKIGDNARKMFSLAESSIQDIKEKNNKTFVFTELFVIDAISALESEEISLLSRKKINPKYFKIEKELIEELEKIDEFVSMELFTIKEAKNLKEDLYRRSYFQMLKKNKWSPTTKRQS